MFCKIFFYYNNEDWSTTRKLLESVSYPYRIITTSESLNKFLKENGMDSKTFQELFLDYDQVTWDTNRQAKKVIKQYENFCKDITFRGFKIFKGLENHILTEIVLLERCKKLLERKNNTIFIFEGYSYTYFAILKAAMDLGYEIDNNELAIGYLHANETEYIRPDKNYFILENRNKLNFIRALYPLLKSNISENKFKLIFYMLSKISSLAIRSISLKISNTMNLDMSDNLLKRIDRRVSLTDSKCETECAFFLSSEREDMLKPFYMILDKFKENSKKFQVFTVEPITSSFFSKRGMSFVDLFDEIYLLANSLKSTPEAKILNNHLEEVAIKNNLYLLYIKQLHPFLLDVIYRSLATSIICDHIVKQMNLKSIVIIDGTMLGNSVTLVSKKYKIPSFYIESLQVDTNPLSSERFEADKICIYGMQGFDDLVALGYEKDRIVITGNPKYDYVKSVDSIKAKKFLEEAYHIDSKKKLVVIAMSRWHRNDEEWMANIIKFCNKNNFEIIIKIHPIYKVLSVESQSKIKYITDNCKDQKYLVTHDLDLPTILSGSDVVISDYSNVGAEVILLGKPLITFNFTKEKLDNAQRYHEYGASLYIEDYNKLENIMLDILLENKYMEELKKGRQKIIDLYNYYNDGNSAQRIYDLLVNG